MSELTLIIPAKNEKESLPKVLRILKNYNCKIIVSLQKDDHETIESIKDFDVKIYEQTGLGYGNSLREGINQCSTKYFCIYNADGSFEEKDLKQMLINCEKNDFVFASRYLRGVAVMMIQLLHMLVINFFISRQITFFIKFNRYFVYICNR